MKFSSKFITALMAFLMISIVSFSPATAFAQPGNSSIENAISWAQDLVGESSFPLADGNGYRDSLLNCAKFVANAYGSVSAGYSSAYELWNGSEQNKGDWDAPRGSLVFFSPNSGNKGYGHVALCTGSGNLIEAGYSTIKESSISAENEIATYLGWAWPPSSWPGKVNNSLGIGDYVYLGEYYNQPILWRVINEDTINGLTLFTENIICLKAFDASGDGTDGRTDSFRKTRGSNYWEKSNLREWLNSNETNVSFSQQPPDDSHVCDGFWNYDARANNNYESEPGFLTNFTSGEISLIQPVTYKSLIAPLDASVHDGGNGYGSYGYFKMTDNIDGFYDYTYKNVTDIITLPDIYELQKYVYDRGWDYYRKPTAEAVLKSENKDSRIADDKIWYYWTKTAYCGSSGETMCVAPDDHFWFVFDLNGTVGVAPIIHLYSDTRPISGDGTATNPYMLISRACTVTFDSQGGSSVASITVSKNNKITQPAPPTKTGYTFAGWYKEAACIHAWNFSSDVMTSDITLYAKWIGTPTIKASSASYNSINVSWNSISGASGYEVYRAASSGGSYSRIYTATSGSTVSYTNTGLTTGKTYYYKVRAYCKAGSTATYGSYSGVCKATALTYQDKIVSGKLKRTYYNNDGSVNRVQEYYGTSASTGVKKVSYYSNGVRTTYKLYNTSGKLTNLVELYSSGKTKKVSYYSTSTGKRYAYKIYDTAGRMTHYAVCFSDGKNAKKMNYYNPSAGVRTGYKTYRTDGSCSCYVKCDSKGSPSVATYYDVNGKVIRTVKY